MKIEKYQEYYDKANELEPNIFYDEIKILSENEKVILYNLREKDLYSSYKMYKMETRKNNLYFWVELYLIFQLVWFVVGLLIFLFSGNTTITTY